MKKLLLILTILVFPFIGIRAVNLSLGRDSTSVAYKPDTFTERTLLPASLLTTSLLYNDNILDKSIIKLGGINSPALKAANVTQYSPAGIMFALKLAGVESRSDWPRMLTADIGAVAIMNAIAQGTKYTVRRERPDGRARNSYPSGHTATAFMTATMLHKEYGETLSPWIGATGYGIAATTGIFRVVANRHWCSDVMAGAAIGIFSTEVAYELTDILFGEQRLRKPIVAPCLYETPQWKFGLYSDYSLDAEVFTGRGYGNPNAKPACSIGIDATWMAWYIGPTLRAGVTQMKWTGPQDIYLPDNGSVADVYTVGAGLDMDIPVMKRLSLNGQAIAGYSPKANSYSFLDAQNQPVEWDIPAGLHYFGNVGLTLRTSSFSSVSVHGGLDYYDKVWRSFVMGARFNYTF